MAGEEAAAAAADAGKTTTADAAKTTAAKVETKTETKVDAKADAGKVEFKLPDEYKAKDGAPDVAKIVGKFSEFEAERNARGLPPESADKYEFAAPKDLKLPDGSPAEIDADSPLIKQFRDAAFELKLPQAAAQKLFELGVEREFSLMADAKKAADDFVLAEKGKLGSKGDERINNVGNWFKSHFGAEGAAFIETMNRSDQVVLMEKMIAKFGGATVAGASKDALGSRKDGADLAALYPSMHKA